ncbi:Bromodomain-containing protein [Fusarium tricinctum]|uniref:Bromodomain-containing protein n=1 Tax=Fusarium tricinctum TaxID=61284 RepID=A0A8K0S047_9HYPO|nr:Bromodomain-containing protein [Fusarium tricinctum]
MDSKRKANGAASVDTDDRGSKRRRLTGDFDLSKGETKESTTAYGMSFLEQVRRTADKSGRLIASNFEELPSREEDADYYKKTRMPISLSTIEKKLNNGEFKNLSEVEGYFKRMISNAKEYFSRSTEQYDDAERIRKALSNFMTKTNPAYHVRGYQALPAPFPDSDGAEGDEDNENEEDENDDEPEEDKEDENEDDEEEEEEEEEEEPSSRRRTITLKRRGPGRPPASTPRRASTRGRDAPKTPAPTTKPDHQYENVPYKGLSFQGAQEKIMEELIRREDPGYEGSYFEAFINLPPRSLKEYFKVISEPISIRKLQKMVKGVHARGETTGSSDFKSWAAFEEKAKLLWTNAYFFNEEGSEIYSVAQELEEFFYDQLKQAQAAVAEPSQPKIKLKVGGSSDTPTPGPKKITIHVGGQRDSADSPAPAQQKEAITNGLNVNGAARTSTPAQVTNPQLEKVTSASASALPSPTPSTQAAPSTEEATKATPAPLMRTLSGVATQGTPGVPIAAPIAAPAPVPVAPPQPIHNPLINGYMEQKHPRRAGKGIDDALIETMKIQVHPSLQSHSPILATIKPNPLEMDQAATLNLPTHLTRILVVTAIPSHLQNRQYSLWTLVNRQPLKPILHQASGQKPHERAFEAMLHPGVNLLESHLIAAIPRDERVPGGPEVELETFTISVNVLRN